VTRFPRPKAMNAYDVSSPRTLLRSIPVARCGKPRPTAGDGGADQKCQAGDPEIQRSSWTSPTLSENQQQADHQHSQRRQARNNNSNGRGLSSHSSILCVGGA